MRRPILKSDGFTLIELVIAVAIVGILAAIAIPTYNSQVEKGRLADARAALTEDGHFLERWYADNGSYKNGAAWPTLPVTGTDYFTISFTAQPSSSDGNSYNLQAMPRPQFNSGNAKYLRMDQDGNIQTCSAPGGTEQCEL